MKSIFVVFVLLVLTSIALFSCQGIMLQSAPDNIRKVIPPSCPEKSINCARLSAEDSHRMGDIPSLKMLSDKSDEGWLLMDSWAEKNRAVLLYKNDDYRQYRVHTSIWKFPDDVYISIDFWGNIIIQSQSRLGKSDLGKNPKRLKKLSVLIEEAILPSNI